MENNQEEPLTRDELVQLVSTSALMDNFRIRQESRPLSAMSMSSVDGVLPMMAASYNGIDAASQAQPNNEIQINSLLAQTASLLAVNEQLRKEIAE